MAGGRARSASRSARVGMLGALIAAASFAAIPAGSAAGASGRATTATPNAACAGTTPITPGAAATTAAITDAGEVGCYTFAARFHDPVMVRVVATDGTLAPSTQVLDPKGNAECGPAGAVEQICHVDLSGTQTVAVADATGANTGGYTVFVQNLKRPTGCTPISFGDAAINGTISVTGSADCYTFKAASGRRLISRVVATAGDVVPETEVFSHNGSSQCDASTTMDQTCRLLSNSTHTLVVRDSSGPGTGGYSLYLQLSRPMSCTTIGMGDTATTGAITVPGNVDCYTFRSTAGEHVRIDSVATDGTLQILTQVLKPDGALLCGPSSALEQTCRLPASGRYTIVVGDSAGTGTGGYALYVQQLNDPARCRALVPGADPFAASITVAADANCYTFDGIAGHPVTVDVVGLDGTLVPNTEVVTPTGSTLCGPSTATEQVCRLTGTGTYSILVRDAVGTGTGGFTVSVTTS